MGLERNPEGKRFSTRLEFSLFLAVAAQREPILTIRRVMPSGTYSRVARLKSTDFSKERTASIFTVVG
jgi:hypothetical protein